MNTRKTIEDKIAGAIYGFAIGDAMGATTEFMNEFEIKRCGKVTDIVGGGWLNLKAGDVTDDTQMTICVMDALEKYSNNIIEFKLQCIYNFAEWYFTKPKDIGGQCRKGITHYILLSKGFIPEDNDALGNGSLMRAMPCAILNKPDFNVVQGILTHNNQKCSQIILEYTRLIQNIIYNNLYTLYIESLLEPSGYIWNTFNNSVYWGTKHSFKEAIIGAVNHGGDADTIAAIAGSIAGARYGYNSIPKEWINKLNPTIKFYLEKFKNFCFSYVQI